MSDITNRDVIVEERLSSDTFLADLAKIIDQDLQTPAIGVEASSRMARCFEAVAADVERIAQDSVDRALEVQQEAQTFATVIRKSGEALCGRIEQESAKARQVSMILRNLSETLTHPGAG